MSKLTITEAVERIAPSESTLRRDMKSGKVSFETDPKGRKLIDVSELTRVYGQLKRQNGTPTPAEDAEPVNDTHQNPPVNENSTPQNQSTTENDNLKVVALLENQVADLQKQLELSNKRATTLIDEKAKLLDLLSAEKDEKRALMPPPEEKTKESKSWLLRLIGAR